MEQQLISTLSKSLGEFFPKAPQVSVEKASTHILALSEQSCLMEHAQGFSYNKPWNENPNQRNALYKLLEIGFMGHIDIYSIIKYLLKNEQIPSGSILLSQTLEKIKSCLEEGQRIEQAFRSLGTPSYEQCLLDASSYGFFEHALAGARHILSPMLEEPCSKILLQKKLSSSDELLLREIFVDLSEDSLGQEVFHFNPLSVLSCCNATFVDLLPPSWESMGKFQNRKTFYQALSTLMEMGMPMANALKHLSNYEDLPFQDFATAFCQAFFQDPNDLGVSSPTFLFLSQYSHKEASTLSWLSKTHSLTEAVKSLR